MRADLVQLCLGPQQGIVGPLLQLHCDPHRLPGDHGAVALHDLRERQDNAVLTVALMRLIGIPNRQASA
jgi:hypothetical protein